MICVDMQPISLVEDRGFQSLLSLLDSKYELPSRRKTASLLTKLYSDKYDELVEDLAKIDHVALTSDIWTSRAVQSFQTITCHYITPSWEMKSVVLEIVEMAESHTAEKIASALEKGVERFGTKEKIVAIATDNAANVVAAVRDLGWNCVSCFAHTLNLIVTNAIRSVPDILPLQKKCRNIVSFFHRSVKVADKLKSFQANLELPEHKLIQDVETRWNSTFLMFERLVERHEAVTATVSVLDRHDLCISSQELQKMKEALLVLKPFEATTREVSAEKYVSISKSIPLARFLQHLTSQQDTSNPSVKALADNLRGRFTNIEKCHLLVIGTLLDPRFKRSPSLMLLPLRRESYGSFEKWQHIQIECKGMVMQAKSQRLRSSLKRMIETTEDYGI